MGGQVAPEVPCLAGGQRGVAPILWAWVLAAPTVLEAHSSSVSLAACGFLPLLPLLHLGMTSGFLQISYVLTASCLQASTWAWKAVSSIILREGGQ